MVGLLRELHQLVLDTGAELGVSPEDAHRAVWDAVNDPSRDRLSAATMRSNEGLADMLHRWRNERRYRRPDGTPRVIPIKGKGVTLESLARRFVPAMPFPSVVEELCNCAEVARLDGDRVALIGSSVMMTQKTPEYVLASLIVRLRRLRENALVNAAVPLKRADGWFDRVVTGVFTGQEFEAFSKDARRHLQLTCDRIDHRLKPPGDAKPGKGMRVGGFGVYVFRDDLDFD
jgi:hypothetical protein